MWVKVVLETKVYGRVLVLVLQAISRLGSQDTRFVFSSSCLGFRPPLYGLRVSALPPRI